MLFIYFFFLTNREFALSGQSGLNAHLWQNPFVEHKPDSNNAQYKQNIHHFLLVAGPDNLTGR